MPSGTLIQDKTLDNVADFLFSFDSDYLTVLQKKKIYVYIS